MLVCKRRLFSIRQFRGDFRVMQAVIVAASLLTCIEPPLCVVRQNAVYLAEQLERL